VIEVHGERIMCKRSGAVVGLLLLASVLIISTRVYSMCNDEVSISDTEYITGCIINPGFVSPGEYLYTVRVKPRNGHVSTAGSYYTYVRKTGRHSFDVLYKWYTPFKAAPEIEEKIDMHPAKGESGKNPVIKLRSASDCTAASVKILGFKGDQLEHQIIISDTCRTKIKK
jgi:hypothetical protein